MLLNNSKNKNKNSTSSLDCGSKSIIFPDCGLRLYIHHQNNLHLASTNLKNTPKTSLNNSCIVLGFFIAKK